MKIVLSYRRSDTEEITGRIFDRLRSQFGHDSVFMDVDNIPFGVDFRRQIQKELEGCDALLAIIGPRWLGGSKGQRIKEETDFVRLEVETALQRDIPVVPVLIKGAKMPRLDQLPETLRELAFRQAAPVGSGRDFHAHMDRVIRSLDDLLTERAEQEEAVRQQEEWRSQQSGDRERPAREAREREDETRQQEEQKRLVHEPEEAHQKAEQERRAREQEQISLMVGQEHLAREQKAANRQGAEQRGLTLDQQVQQRDERERLAQRKLLWVAGVGLMVLATIGAYLWG